MVSRGAGSVSDIFGVRPMGKRCAAAGCTGSTRHRQRGPGGARFIPHAPRADPCLPAASGSLRRGGGAFAGSPRGMRAVNGSVPTSGNALPPLVPVPPAAAPGTGAAEADGTPPARTPYPAWVRGHPRSAVPGDRGGRNGKAGPPPPQIPRVCPPGTSSSGRLVSAGPPSLSAGTLVMVRPARLLVPPAAAASGRAVLGAGPGGGGGAGAGRRGRGGTGRGRGGAAGTDRGAGGWRSAGPGLREVADGTRGAGLGTRHTGTWDTVPGI